jgi:DNA-binding FadR family transcriptional regulator
MRRKLAPAPVKPVPLALSTLERFRDEILEFGPGHFLGGEADLLARYGLSRPTFRQVTRVLEQEQLLTVKRGKNGGFYTRAPTMEHVQRAATNYLRSRQTSIAHLEEAAGAIAPVMARYAALSRDEVARQKMADARKQMIAQFDLEQTPLEFHACNMIFGAAVAELTANPVLELQLGLLYQQALEGLRREALEQRGDRQTALRAVQIRLAEAILQREPIVAEALSRREIELVQSWAEEDQDNKRVRPRGW